MTKSVGAANDAAMVCPTSTLRVITVPWIGDTIFVKDKFSDALSKPARACASAASEASTAASAARAFASAVSAVGFAIRFCAASCRCDSRSNAHQSQKHVP